MRVRRFLGASILALLVMAGGAAAGISSSGSTAQVCACVSLNEVLGWDLGELDDLVQQYAAEHGGLFPTYLELAAVAPDSLRPKLTPQVDAATRTFTFTPSRSDAGKMGYAVSYDRRSYALLGIGVIEKYKDTYLFGYHVDKRIVGYELPILQPGEAPPEPSPPA